MANVMIWVVLGLILLLALITIIVYRRGIKRPVDYFNLFVMGIIWFPFGLLMWWRYGNSSVGTIFTILGLVYMVIGLTHKKDWKKNHRTWEQLTNKERKTKMIIITILSLFVLIGAITFYFISKGV